MLCDDYGRLSLASGPAGLSEADFQNALAVFGLHDGTDQILALLERFGLKATFFVPAAMTGFLSDMIKRIAAAGHEIAAGGFKHEDVREQARLSLTTEILTKAAGRRPSG